MVGARALQVLRLLLENVWALAKTFATLCHHPLMVAHNFGVEHMKSSIMQALGWWS